MNARPYDHYQYLKGNYICWFIIFCSCILCRSSEIILSLRNKPGNINTISTAVLKRIRRHVSHVLCHIINLSLPPGIFPDCLKLARVTPIPKGGDSTNTGNYRPTSVLPIFSKIFEKLYINNYTHILNKYMLYDPQCGFRKHMSTVQAILNHMQFMYDSIDSGNFDISVYILRF